MAAQNTPSKSREMERRPSSGGMQRRDPLWSPSAFFETSPFGLMRRFAEQMDRTFGGNESMWGRGGAWSPAIDVFERDGKLIVHADLPGMNKDDVKVEVADNQLIIQGERRQQHEEHEGESWRSERSYGSFYRSIPLPENAKMDEARAEFKDGVLEISMPAPAEQRRGRQVPIEGGTGSQERREAGAESKTKPPMPKAS
jgi:HSP20 family protein